MVTSRGEMRDSTRTPSLDSLVGRMHLDRFEALPLPPDPKYKVAHVWPGWRGEVRASFTSLLQVPPDTRPGGKYRSSDSLAVGVWVDSTGLRFHMAAVGCADCGNLIGKGEWQSGTAVGTWAQDFLGTGDAGRWRMRRVESRSSGRE